MKEYKHLFKIGSAVGIILVVALLALLCAPVSAQGTVYFDETREHSQTRMFLQYDVTSDFTMPVINGFEILKVVHDYRDEVPGLLCVEFNTCKSLDDAYAVCEFFGKERGEVFTPTLRDGLEAICRLDGVLWASPDYLKERDDTGSIADFVKSITNPSKGLLKSSSKGETIVTRSGTYYTQSGEEIVLSKSDEDEILTMDAETYQKYSFFTPPDRVSVTYHHNTLPSLNWDIIYEYPGLNGLNFAEIMYKIPDGMTLADAVEYCDNLGLDVYPDIEMIHEYHNEAKDYEHKYACLAHKIMIAYKQDTEYTLPWDIVEQEETTPIIHYLVRIPDNMSVFDAVTYALKNENVVKAGICTGMVPLHAVSAAEPIVKQPTASPKSPVSILIIISAVSVAGIIPLRKKQ